MSCTTCSPATAIPGAEAATLSGSTRPTALDTCSSSSESPSDEVSSGTDRQLAADGIVRHRIAGEIARLLSADPSAGRVELRAMSAATECDGAVVRAGVYGLSLV